MANVCGTGAWGGPLPGDPDNTSILSVAPAYGGIDVSWTLPFTNANAVSYVSVFRAAHNDPTLMVRRAVVGGDYFFDRILANEVREYFYWIQIVSINGTVGELIGPASTTPMLRIDEMLAALTGQIDQSLLAVSLQTQLGEIPLLQYAMGAESAERLASNLAMADALEAVQTETGQVLTYIQQETQLRTDNDEVILDSVNALAVGMEGLGAALVQEGMVRADQYSALALQITTAETTFGDNLAGVEVTLGAAITTLTGNVTNIGALYTAKVGVNGLVGGFGIYNDATEVQAGFDVDTFWIGRTAANKRKPFIVSEDVVYIDDAVINKLTFSKLRDDVGSFIVEDGKVKADYITIGVASIGDAQIDRGSANKLQILSADIVDAQITTAKIQDLAVDTLKLAGQAVTIPVGVYTAAAVSLGLSQNGTGLLTLQTATITSTGAPIVITGAFRDSSTAGLDAKNLRIYRDATLLVNIAIDNTGGVYLYSFPFIDTPGVGTFVYTLKFYGDAGEFSIPTLTGSHRSLTLLEVKR